MNDLTQTPEMLIATMGARARRAAAEMALAPSEQKAQALIAAAKSLRESTSKIILANRTDMERGAANGLSSAMLDRLRLDEGRIAAVADAVEQVATLADPVGHRGHQPLLGAEVIRDQGLVLTGPDRHLGVGEPGVSLLEQGFVGGVENPFSGPG